MGFFYHFSFPATLLQVNTICGGDKKCICLFVHLFYFSSHPQKNSEYWKQIVCHNGKNWRLWKAVEAKKEHCIEWKGFIWWVRLCAGVGLEPGGNLMIYSLSASADRQEINGLYISACSSVGWFFIRQTAPVRSQYKHRFGFWFSLY